MQRRRAGSSPRVWGQDDMINQAFDKNRIIPTRVGTSQHDSHKTLNFQDHPHACGDKSMLKAEARTSTGSSPRVWGQDLKALQSFRTKRIIPTRVGTRNIEQLFGLVHKDHPHACGDKKYEWNGNIEQLGSSPRVWGQVQK